MRRIVKIALAGASLIGAAAAFNDLARWNVGPVPRWVNGEPHFYQWREGAVYYEAAGPAHGPALLLAHGINAAASSYEMRCIFEPLAAAGFRVFLPDLPGYGRSERPALNYTAGTYVDFWSDFARDVAGAPASNAGHTSGVPAAAEPANSPGETAARPVNVIASSLSAAHVVAAAARHPRRFGHLVLICPTGLMALASPAGPAGWALNTLFRTPIVGTALFDLLVTRPSLAVFLRRQAYADPAQVTRDVVADYYVVAHQPGSRWAPTAFVSGRLNCRIDAALVALPNPIHLAWGREARITPLADADAFRAIRPDATLDIFDRAALLPHVEQAEAFVLALTKRLL